MTSPEDRTPPPDGTSFPVPIEQMRAQVEGEIATAIVGGVTRHEYFNNFRSLLRKADRKSVDNYHYLLRAPLLKVNHAARHSEDPWLLDRGCSQRYLHDSDESFIEAVDWAMAEEKVDGETVEQMDVLAREAADNSSRENQSVLDYIAPVYIRLRSIGYSHIELVV